MSEHEADFLQSFTDDGFMVLCSCGWASEEIDAAAALLAHELHRRSSDPRTTP